jgi:hypothetical protein
MPNPPSNRPKTPPNIPVSNDFSLQTPDRLFPEVGRALSDWVTLESTLILLLGALLKSNSAVRDALGAPFAQIGELRIMIKHQVSRSYDNTQFGSNVADFMDEVHAFAHLRDLLIHSIVARYNNGNVTGFFVRPPDTATEYMSIDRPLYRWSLTEMALIVGHFTRLTNECRTYISTVP